MVMGKKPLDSYRAGSTFSLKDSKYRINESGEKRLVGDSAMHGFDNRQTQMYLKHHID
jgi:hypothetical protein